MPALTSSRWGAMLYEMTTGKVAFPGKTAAVIFKAAGKHSTSDSVMPFLACI